MTFKAAAASFFSPRPTAQSPPAAPHPVFAASGEFFDEPVEGFARLGILVELDQGDAPPEGQVLLLLGRHFFEGLRRLDGLESRVELLRLQQSGRQIVAHMGQGGLGLGRGAEVAQVTLVSGHRLRVALLVVGPVSLDDEIPRRPGLRRRLFVLRRERSDRRHGGHRDRQNQAQTSRQW